MTHHQNTELFAIPFFSILFQLIMNTILYIRYSNLVKTYTLDLSEEQQSDFYNHVHDPLIQNHNYTPKINKDFYRFILVDNILIPIAITYMSYCDRIHRDKHVSLYYEVISKGILEYHKIETTCNAYTQVLFNIFPDFVAKQNLISCPRQIRVRDESGNNFQRIHLSRFTDVSILYADIAGFTQMSAQNTAEQVVKTLHQLFLQFDKLASENDCYRIKLLGDCYYCVSGINSGKQKNKGSHANNCTKMAFDMIENLILVAELNGLSECLNMRIGIHTGTVHCGVIGVHRWQFDVWSNDVTIASIMESSGKPGQVQVSQVTAKHLLDKWELQEREYDGPNGRYENIVKLHPNIKNLSDMKTYWVVKEKPSHIRESKMEASTTTLGRKSNSKQQQLLGKGDKSKKIKSFIQKELDHMNQMQTSMLNNLTIGKDVKNRENSQNSTCVLAINCLTR